MRLLGIDSGGTKTLAALADDTGQILSLTSSDSLDPTTGADWEGALTRLIAGFGPVDALAAGLPFHGELAAVSQRQSKVVRAAGGAGAQVLNDVAIAFHGALAGAEGVLLLAGTGSMAWARGPKGEVRSGGFGDIFGDEGSAYWLGREALALTSRALDGRGEASALTRAICSETSDSALGLIDWTYRQPSPRRSIAALARVVTKHNHCPEAARLVQTAAAHLAAHVSAARRSAGLTEQRWSYAGGLFSDPILRAAVIDRVGTQPRMPLLPPIGGALLVAARAKGLPITETFLSRIQDGLTSLQQP